MPLSSPNAWVARDNKGTNGAKSRLLGGKGAGTNANPWIAGTNFPALGSLKSSGFTEALAAIGTYEIAYLRRKMQQLLEILTFVKNIILF
jgi:hypothetical protein